MHQLESVEVRWFLEPADARLATIAARFARFPSEGEREDRYQPTGREDLGIKVRAEAGKPAKVETKYRVGEMGPIELSPDVVGRCERWRKLSVDAEAKSVAPSAGEIAVGKERKLRKLAYDAGALKEVSPGDRPAAGCNVEWTAVKRSGAVVAWTLGLEAFGPDAALLFEILRKAAVTFFAEAPGLALDEAGSIGYGAWVELTRARASGRATP